MTWWHRLWNRTKMEEQLDAELQFHLEQHTTDLISKGYDPEEARRQAIIALGGPEQVKEKCRDARGTRWLEDLWQDFHYAIRSLRKRPGFAAVALCTLALGCGSTTLLFTIINSVLLTPLPYREPNRLVTLHERTEQYGDRFAFSYLNFLDCQRESQSLAPMAAWRFGGGTVSEPGEPEYVSGRQISSDLFTVLGIPLLEGRAFLAEEDRPGGAPVIILGQSFWQRRFGERPGVIGMSIVFDGKPYTVVGIAPPSIQLFGETDLFTPLGQNTARAMQNREAHPGINVLARIQPGVTMEAAQTELALISRHLAEQYPKSNTGHSIVAQPLHQELVGDISSTLWLLLGAVGLVLLIACVNVASLLLARAVSRERELAIRVALGAGRGRLIRQCLTESCVLGLSGGLLGVLLAIVGIRPFLFFWPGSLPRAEEVQVDWHVLLFALAASLLSGILFGMAPALRAPAHALERTLRAGARSSTGSSRRLHSGFVVSEIALAVVLLVCAGMLGRTLLRLSSVDAGLNTRDIITARVAISPGALADPVRTRVAWRDILDRVRQVPGVQSVALADIVPMREGENELGYWTTAAQPPLNQAPIALASCVTPDYLAVTGIPLRQGRFLNEQDRLGAEPVVVIDEVLAQHAFNGQEPIGKRLWIQGVGPSVVVGVVGHVRHWGLAGDDQAKVRAQLYYPFAQVPDTLLHFFSSFMTLEIRTNLAPSNIVESVRLQIQGASGDQAVYDVRTMEQIVRGTLARQRFLLLLFGIFAGLALLLACVGIYGVLAYLTSQRVPEIGVRMALGARPRDVVYLILRQSIGMTFTGITLGCVAALAAGRLLEHLIPGLRAAEPLTFAIMISILVFAAIVASFVPAHRASRVDPMMALRQE